MNVTGTRLGSIDRDSCARDVHGEFGNWRFRRLRDRDDDLIPSIQSCIVRDHEADEIDSGPPAIVIRRVGVRCHHARSPVGTVLPIPLVGDYRAVGVIAGTGVHSHGQIRTRRCEQRNRFSGSRLHIHELLRP